MPGTYQARIYGAVVVFECINDIWIQKGDFIAGGTNGTFGLDEEGYYIGGSVAIEETGDLIYFTYVPGKDGKPYNTAIYNYRNGDWVLHDVIIQ